MNEIHARVRPELILTEAHTDRERHWIVEDPVALKYFRLRDEEYFVLKSLSGDITLMELKRQFNEHFHPLRLGLRQLNRFLFHLHDLGLIVSDIQGQGDILTQRRRSNQRKRILSSCTNPLAIRIPGIAAKQWIDRIYPKVKILFSRSAISAWILIVLLATSVVAINFGAFQARLPSFADFFNPSTAIWFAVALMVSKALHELGHALVCKHLGGNCREIGVIFLAFVPTLYCDVSDVWRLPNRWHRIMVSMAGIVTELVLASIVTLIWWFSEPGELQALALRVLFLCSISTLLFNINPLVRCDGYYVLSDLTNTPNLWQESRAQWRRAMMSWLSGQPMVVPQCIPRNHVFLLMLYAAGSTIYCWVLIVGILWMTFRILEPYGLVLLAWMLSAMAMTGYIAPSFSAFVKVVASPIRRRGLRIKRTVAAAIAASALVTVLFLIPLPSRMTVPFVIELHHARPIFAPVSGRLKSAVADQAIVAAGDPLVELTNEEIDSEIATISQEVEQHRTRLANLQKLLLADPSVGPLIPGEQQSLKDSMDRLTLWQQDRDRLVLRAPIDGTVFSPPVVFHESLKRLELASWSGTPLQPENRGAMIQVGQLICLVGKPDQLRANALIAQSDVSRIRHGQEVVMRIEQLPALLFRGNVVDVSKADAKDIPSELLHRLQLLPSMANPRGDIYYQATIHFDSPDVMILQGMTGQAKVSTDRCTIAHRVMRLLTKHFTLR